MEIVWCFSLLFLDACTSGSVIVFTASPATVVQDLTEHAVLRCGLNDTAASASVIGRRDIQRTPTNVLQVSSIIIMQNGVDVASVTQGSVKLLVNATNVNATGDVSTAGGERGFLELALQYPAPSQLGEYQCEIAAIGASGHAVIFKTNVEITVSQPTIADLITDLKKTNERQKQTNEQQQKTIERQQETIQCMSQRVAFKAEPSYGRYSSSILTLPSQQTVVWDRVVLNQGGGYNSNSGEFTAPAPGLYEFHVHVQGAATKEICLQLEKNGQQLVDLYKDYRDQYDDATLSHYVELERGDVVSVREACSSALYQESDSSNLARINYVMGRLVAASGCSA